MNKNIGMIIHNNQHLTDIGPLCEEFFLQNFNVILFINSDIKEKPHLSPYIDQTHFKKVKHGSFLWYKDNKELSQKLKEENVCAVFTEETIPFFRTPELFKNRTYKIYSIVHSVDNFHDKAIENGSIDTSIVAFEKYGDYLNWDKKDYVVLGLPKYDVIEQLDAENIRNIYDLPEKYILLLTPNNNLLSWFVVYKMVRQLKKAGYSIVLKGKRPKCHKWIYRLFSDNYFLSDGKHVSYYPFITHELIHASSGVIGFDTTAVEEILMIERLLVNFSIKPYRDKAAREGNFKQFVPMWNAEYVLDLNIMNYKKFGMFKKLPKFIHHFEKKNIDYTKIQRETFSIPGRSSKRIVEWVKDQLGL